MRITSGPELSDMTKPGIYCAVFVSRSLIKTLSELRNRDVLVVTWSALVMHVSLAILQCHSRLTRFALCFYCSSAPNTDRLARVVNYDIFSNFIKFLVLLVWSKLNPRKIWQQVICWLYFASALRCQHSSIDNVITVLVWFDRASSGPFWPTFSLQFWLTFSSPFCVPVQNSTTTFYLSRFNLECSLLRPNLVLIPLLALLSVVYRHTCLPIGLGELTCHILFVLFFWSRHIRCPSGQMFASSQHTSVICLQCMAPR